MEDSPSPSPGSPNPDSPRARSIHVTFAGRAVKPFTKVNA
jgi:hypothetical protein